MKSLFQILLFAMAVTPSPGQDRVQTVAGQPLVTGTTDGSTAQALFNDPASIVADPKGNLYIADSANHIIRKISTNGIVTTVAGRAGMAAFQDGLPSLFNSPSGIAISSTGDLIIADTGNHLIRKITPAGVVSTIAGATAQPGAVDAVGTSARFDSPLGLAISSDGTIYVADTGNHTIRAISTNRAVTTLAGSPGDWGTVDDSGPAARFNGPLGLALDNNGNLFVSDSNNQTIRKITPDRAVTTWAGAPLIDGFVNGHRLDARFSKPAELRFDPRGNLYIADSFNHAIRKISPDGNVTTATGFSGAAGASDGINGRPAFYNPYSLAPLPDGRLAISDAYNQLIRRATPPIELKHNHPSNPAHFSWTSIIGSQYQVQFTFADFNSWTNLGPPTTANETITIFDETNSTTDNLRIYRVIDAP